MRRRIRKLLDRLSSDVPGRGQAARPLSPPVPPAPPSDPEQVVRAYHDRTRHFPGRYARSLGLLDWDSQPDPFRRYEGASAVELALSHELGPPFEATFVEGQVAPALVDQAAISRLFADSLGLSAWKEAGDARWSLRVNPSSGNLHPTEGYLVCGTIPGIDAGVYHYDAYRHALERRGGIAADFEGLMIGLTSIHWRESWKYGERAFRYCQHDVGHALAAVAVAAAALGWRARLVDASDDDVAALLGVAGQVGPDTEQPDLLIRLGPGVPLPEPPTTWQGVPNPLSRDHHDWPVIDEVALAARRLDVASWPEWQRPERSFQVGGSDLELRRIVHQRRSAVDMDGRTGLTRAAFDQVLAKVLPGEGQVPFTALPWSPQVDLLLFVHRVEGLEPGLYALVRDKGRLERLQGALDPGFAWERQGPLPLYLLRAGDVRGVAAGTSCGQGIASDGVFAVAMLAELGGLERFGAWFYRALHWECGTIGQQLYLEAEASGVRATGIGCFFDSDSARAFGVTDRDLAVLYHFTVGGPVNDERLRTLAPYGHLGERGQENA